MEIAERAVEKIDRIDADWLGKLDEAVLRLFAIDHLDAWTGRGASSALLRSSGT